MSKIPNWSRKKDDFDERDFPYMWEHDNTEARVVVKKIEGLHGKNYEVYVINKTQPGVVYIEKNFSKKERAREEAVDWMRDHEEDLPDDIV